MYAGLGGRCRVGKLAAAGLLLGLLTGGMAGRAAAGEATLVTDLNVGSATAGAAVGAVQPLGPGVLFLVGDDLRRSDGTLGGTVPVYSFCSFAPGCGDEVFLGATATAAFLAVDGELWATDGTAGGTVPLGATLGTTYGIPDAAFAATAQA